MKGNLKSVYVVFKGLIFAIVEWDLEKKSEEILSCLFRIPPCPKGFGNECVDGVIMVILNSLSWRLQL